METEKNKKLENIVSELNNGLDDIIETAVKENFTVEAALGVDDSGKYILKALACYRIMRELASEAAAKMDKIEAQLSALEKEIYRLNKQLNEKEEPKNGAV